MKDARPDRKLADVRLLPVIPNPEKILCAGINYRSHAAETGRELPKQPSMFIRLANTLTGQDGEMIRPSVSQHFDFEGELAVVIGRGGRHIPVDRALEHVAGYTCFVDGSVRDYQKFSVTSGKNFPGTGPLGPWLVTTDEIPDPTRLTLTTRLNGQAGPALGHRPADLFGAADHRLLLGLYAAVAGRCDRHRHAGRRRPSPHPAALDEGRRRARRGDFRHRHAAQPRHRRAMSAEERPWGIDCWLIDCGSPRWHALRRWAFRYRPAPATAATKVSFGQVSPTATIWPAFVATKKGFFAQNGVEIDMVSIGVSPGMQAVASGSLNIMHNTCNAPISFIEAGGNGVHISLVSMGIHPGVVVGKKGVKSAADLKGQVVGTSSIKSGSTILLRRVLKARGLGPSDYDLVAGQGSAQIFQGLQAGALAAVWLVPPQSLSRINGGFPVIGTFKEVAPKFPFVCFVTNDNWVKNNTAAAQGFAKAWLAAVAWLYDPANRAEAEKLLADELKLAAGDRRGDLR